MDWWDNVAQMGIEITFSILVLLLLVTTLIYWRVKYGNIVVTHLTAGPY